MKNKLIAIAAFGVFLAWTNVWADKPTPSWNGKPADKMTSQEMRDANKALDQQIKKGDSSAVQQKTDLNKAFDKTPEGQKMKKEDQLAKDKDELAILEKQEDANAEREIDDQNMEGALTDRGDFWNPPNKWPAPPDGNIGPGGDRDRMAKKLKQQQEKAKAAKEEAEKKIKEMKEKIQKLEDELYVKTKDTKSIQPPGTGEIGPERKSSDGMIEIGGSPQTLENFQIPVVVTSPQSGSNQSAQNQQSQPSPPPCPPSDR